jgi:hypothetical protein
MAFRAKATDNLADEFVIHRRRARSWTERAVTFVVRRTDARAASWIADREPFGSAVIYCPRERGMVDGARRAHRGWMGMKRARSSRLSAVACQRMTEIAISDPSRKSGLGVQRC